MTVASKEEAAADVERQAIALEMWLGVNSSWGDVWLWYGGAHSTFDLRGNEM